MRAGVVRVSRSDHSTGSAADDTGTSPYATRLRIITVRPLAERRGDLEGLLDELLKRDQHAQTIRKMIGKTNLAALIESHPWKDNFVDVREALRRFRALHEVRKQSAAAKLLGN